MTTRTSPRRALITGVTGQDGSYLADLLLERGYEIWGLVRRSSTVNTTRISDLAETADREGSLFHFVWGDLGDASSLEHAIDVSRPHEIYNLAAQSDVGLSFEMPSYTGDVTGVGVTRLLEAVRSRAPEARFYQASSSELFGKVVEIPQTETTRFYPRSPYAAAKGYAFDITRNYREAYGLFAVNGILFNHESPRRGENFVTRKITRAVARILDGEQDQLRLGNLDACATGALPGTTSKPCGPCSRSTTPTTTSSPPASSTRSASSANSPSREPGYPSNGVAAGSTKSESPRTEARSS